MCGRIIDLIVVVRLESVGFKTLNMMTYVPTFSSIEFSSVCYTGMEKSCSLVMKLHKFGWRSAAFCVDVTLASVVAVDLPVISIGHGTDISKVTDISTVRFSYSVQ